MSTNDQNEKGAAAAAAADEKQQQQQQQQQQQAQQQKQNLGQQLDQQLNGAGQASQGDAAAGDNAADNKKEENGNEQKDDKNDSDNKNTDSTSTDTATDVPVKNIVRASDKPWHAHLHQQRYNLPESFFSRLDDECIDSDLFAGMTVEFAESAGLLGDAAITSDLRDGLAAALAHHREHVECRDKLMAAAQNGSDAELLEITRRALALLVERDDDIINRVCDSDLRSFFYTCCMKYRVEAVRLLLQHDRVDKTARTVKGSHAIYATCCAVLLTKAELADFNRQQQLCEEEVRAAVLAAERRALAVLDLLLAHEAVSRELLNAATSNGWTSFLSVAIEGRSLIAERLLQCPQLDVNTPLSADSPSTALYLAAQAGRLDTLRVMLSDEHRAKFKIAGDELFTACFHGRAQCAALLLERCAGQGIDVFYVNQRKNGYTALHAACSCVAATEIKSDADNAREKGIDRRLRDTPDPAACVRLLLAHAARAELGGVARLVNTVSESNNNTALFLACDNGQTETIGLLLDTGVCDVNVRCGKGLNTPLMTACGTEEREKVPLAAIQVLCEKGRPDVALLSKQCWNALLSAVFANRDDIVEYLLAAYGADALGASTATIASNKASAVYLCAEKNYARPMLEMLLNAGVDASLPNINGTSALGLAAERGHVDVVALLIDFSKRANNMATTKIDLDATNTAGNYAAYVACNKGQPEHVQIFKMLLDAGADIFRPTKSGWTPFASACFNGRVELAKMILAEWLRRQDAAASADEQQQEQQDGGGGRRARAKFPEQRLDGNLAGIVYLTMEAGHADILQLLLDHHELFDFNLPNKSNGTPLYTGVANSKAGCVRMLLEHKDKIGLDVDAAKLDGWSPLLLAVFRASERAVRARRAHNERAAELRADGAAPSGKAQQDADARKKEDEKRKKRDERRAARKAREAKNKNSSNNNANGNNGNNGNKDNNENDSGSGSDDDDLATDFVVADLLAAGASLSCAIAASKVSIAYIAAERDDAPTLRMVLLEAERRAGLAEARGDAELAAKLRNLKNEPNANGTTPLIICVQHDCVNTLECLLREFNVDVMQTNRDGVTACYSACRSNRVRALKILLDAVPAHPAEAHMRTFVNTGTKEGWSPFLSCCFNNCVDTLKLLLTHPRSRDVVATDAALSKNGARAVYLASEKGSAEALKFLLECGFDANSSGSGHAPLYIAAHHNHAKACELLLRHGADKDSLSRDGWSCTATAAAIGSDAAVEALLRFGAFTESRIHANSATALYVASEKAHVRSTHALVVAGADIQARSASGTPILTIAAVQAKAAVCTYLLSTMAAPLAAMQDNAGANALSAAVSRGVGTAAEQLEVVRTLLPFMSANAKRGDGHSAMSIAVREGKREVVELLLEYDTGDAWIAWAQSGTNATTDAATTPMLKLASEGRHVAIADMLRERLAAAKKRRQQQL